MWVLIVINIINAQRDSQDATLCTQIVGHTRSRRSGLAIVLDAHAHPLGPGLGLCVSLRKYGHFVFT